MPRTTRAVRTRMDSDMRLDELRSPNGAFKQRKRVGRGISAGQGKTAGRGTKGQNARSGGGVRIGFEGGQNPIYRRMPYKRGFTNRFRVEYQVINLSRLNALDFAGTITPEVLFERRLI